MKKYACPLFPFISSFLTVQENSVKFKLSSTVQYDFKVRIILNIDFKDFCMLNDPLQTNDGLEIKNEARMFPYPF